MVFPGTSLSYDNFKYSGVISLLDDVTALTISKVHILQTVTPPYVLYDQTYSAASVILNITFERALTVAYEYLTIVFSQCEKKITDLKEASEKLSIENGKIEEELANMIVMTKKFERKAHEAMKVERTRHARQLDDLKKTAMLLVVRLTRPSFT